MAKNVQKNPEKLPVSLCMVALNEAANLKRSFEHIGGIVDEILVLDTGSTDGTQEMAEALGAQVFAYTWDENFSHARNFLLEKARNDWVLWIDGDEFYSFELVQEIRDTVNANSDYAGFYFPRRNYYLGKWLRFGGNYPDYQLKLFKKSSASSYEKRTHERVRLRGKAGYLKSWIEHHPYPSVDAYFRKNVVYSGLEAKSLQERGVRVTTVNTLHWLFVKPLLRFIKRYVLKGGFLNGIPGLFAAFFDAAGYITRYIKLWELQKKKE